jgi:hypothetical protein
MNSVVSSPVIAIVGAGAALANPGGFIPLALKTISETKPSATQYVVDWLFFSLVSLLPLGIALLMPFVAQDWAGRVLDAARDWLLRNARTVAAVIVFLLAAHAGSRASSPFPAKNVRVRDMPIHQKAAEGSLVAVEALPP